MKETLNSKLYILVVIGIVSAFGPFVTDFYLPALPVLAGYFDTTASLIQLSLTFSMVGLAVGQLVIGPLSDKYGRKKTLMASLVLFCISTIGCFIRFGYICIYLLPIATRIVRSRWSSYFQIHRHGSLRRERAYSLFFYA